MNKLDLMESLRAETGISKTEARLVVESIFDTIADSLSKKERIEIRGFCSFFVKHYKSHMGSNPKTGEKVFVKAKKLPFFRPGKDLRDRVGFKNK